MTSWFPAGAARTTVTNNFSSNRAFNRVTFRAPYTVHILTNELNGGHPNATVTIHAAINLQTAKLQKSATSGFAGSR